MLAVIYLFATAKPISIRRLSALFIVTLMLAEPLLMALRVRNVLGDAFEMATLVTLLVWCVPLAHVIRCSLFRRALLTEPLRNISGSVQWTYAVTLVGILLVAIAAVHHAANSVHVRDLSQLLIKACAVALAMRLVFALKAIACGIH